METTPAKDEGEPLKIYRISDGVYVRTKADLSTVATLVGPNDVDEMAKARVYFGRCGLKP